MRSSPQLPQRCNRRELRRPLSCSSGGHRSWSITRRASVPCRFAIFSRRPMSVPASAWFNGSSPSIPTANAPPRHAIPTHALPRRRQRPPRRYQRPAHPPPRPRQPRASPPPRQNPKSATSAARERHTGARPKPEISQLFRRRQPPRPPTDYPGARVVSRHPSDNFQPTAFQLFSSDPKGTRLDS